MSKLLSEEQIERLFQNHLSDKVGSGTRKDFYDANKGLEASARTAFKHAFTLLMPIIEAQANELEYYSKEENWSFPMGYGMNKTNICIMDTDELHCGGKRARQALQETKQMLKQLGVINGRHNNV